MRGPVYFLPSLHVRTFWAIENKYGQERRVHKCRAAKEQRSKDGVLSFAPVFCMEEPYAGVYSKAKPAFPVWVCFKSFFNCQICQRTILCGRFEDLGAKLIWCEHRLRCYVHPTSRLLPSQYMLKGHSNTSTGIEKDVTEGAEGTSEGEEK